LILLTMTVVKIRKKKKKNGHKRSKSYDRTGKKTADPLFQLVQFEDSNLSKPSEPNIKQKKKDCCEPVNSRCGGLYLIWKEKNL